MKRLIHLLAWGGLALVVGLSVLNWTTMTAPAPLDLVVARVQAPLGVVLLGLAGLLLAAFFIAYLRLQIGSMLETRKLLKEMQRVQALADQAEASRLEAMRQTMVDEFRRLNERLGRAGLGAPTTGAASDPSLLPARQP